MKHELPDAEGNEERKSPAKLSSNEVTVLDVYAVHDELKRLRKVRLNGPVRISEN